MASDDDFELDLGRMRSGKNGARPGRFLSKVKKATNRARGGPAGRGGCRSFSGSRTGRGGGVGRLLASRDRYAAFRRRRVIVKTRIVNLRGKGIEGARAHLRYIERDGTTRGGERGHLYGEGEDRIDRNDWLAQCAGDRHQFRFIVSAEDGAEYEDLKPLTRRLMARMEADIGTRVDWVAVDHFDTGHPHTHIILRGKDDRGRDLVIARDYIAHGLRERACELVDLDLGPQTDHAIEQRLRAEVEQERLTSIDRGLLRDMARDILVSGAGQGRFDTAIRTGRLRKLEQLGLAERTGGKHWRLTTDAEAVLKRMGEREDIIRIMQRAYSGRDGAPLADDYVIFDPQSKDCRPIIGRIAVHGLADEHRDRYYAIVEATDGRSHFVDLGQADPGVRYSEGAIIRAAPASFGVREADRRIVAVADGNGGRYTIDAHLRHDASASQAFAEAHVRRLEAMRKIARVAEREADGSWIITADHLTRVEAYEEMRVKSHPVTIEILSHAPLQQLEEVHAATWLDHELTAPASIPLRDQGFGGEVRSALARRARWLLAQDLAAETEGGIVCRADLVARLKRRELLAVASALSREVGKPFAEARSGDRLVGRLVRPASMISGRHALIERAHDFTLVPWRADYEKYLGRRIAGVMQRDTFVMNAGWRTRGLSIE